MKMRHLFVFFGVLCILSSAFGRLWDRGRLQRELFRSYTKTIPLFTGEPVKLDISMSLLSINEVNKLNNEVRMTVWVWLRWYDERMIWGGRYANITSLTVSSETIWVPDITVYDQIGKLENEVPGLVRVFHNGNMTWVQKWSIRTLCFKEGVKYVCSLKLGSWVHSAVEVALEDKKDAFDVQNNFSRGPIYYVTNATSSRNRVFYTCCPESYDDLTFTLKFVDENELQSGGLIGRVKSLFWN